jgi:hypothetical protein
MAAVAPLRPDHDETHPQPPLSLVPPLPRSRPSQHGSSQQRQSQHRRDAVYAVTLAVLLGIGIVGVLLLNTAMQTQADRIATTKQQLADLTLRAQVLQTATDEADSPAALAARARLLHLRPAARVAVLALPKAAQHHPVAAKKVTTRPTATKSRKVSVSGRARAVRRARAG